MPELGEIRKARELGYDQGWKCIWSPCRICGTLRWVRLDYSLSVCKHCTGKAYGFKQTRERSARWKGGRIINGNGYISISIPVDDFFRPMADRHGYVMEHRLVMAKHLGRNLHRWEIVHHINHIRTDNRIENLQLVSDDRHKQITILENRIKLLESRVTLLEAENTLLKSEGSLLSCDKPV